MSSCLLRLDFPHPAVPSNGYVCRFLLFPSEYLPSGRQVLWDVLSRRQISPPRSFRKVFLGRVLGYIGYIPFSVPKTLHLKRSVILAKTPA